MVRKLRQRDWRVKRQCPRGAAVPSRSNVGGRRRQEHLERGLALAKARCTRIPKLSTCPHCCGWGHLRPVRSLRKEKARRDRSSPGSGKECDFLPRWLDDDELPTTVLRPCCFVVPRVHRTIFAEADGVDHLIVNAGTNEAFAQGQTTSITQRTIVFLCPAFITMSLDAQCLALQALHTAGDGVKLGCFARFDSGLVEFEIDGITFERLIGGRLPIVEILVTHGHEPIFANSGGIARFEP